MIRDYAGPYKRKGRLFKTRRSRRSGAPSPGGPSKALGVTVSTALLLAVAVSIWFGWSVRNQLRELQNIKAFRRELVLEHSLLRKKRQDLVRGGELEKAARRLGLVKPGPRQLERP